MYAAPTGRKKARIANVSHEMKQWLFALPVRKFQPRGFVFLFPGMWWVLGARYSVCTALVTHAE